MPSYQFRTDSSFVHDRTNSLADTGPILGLTRKLFAAVLGHLVIFCPAVVIRLSPFCLYPSLVFHSVERGINRTFFHLEDVLRKNLDPLGDAPPVQGASAQYPEDQHVESALK